jgi:hypothetical protein
MEAVIYTTESPEKSPAQDMLTAMALHVAESSVPVKSAVRGRTFREDTIRISAVRARKIFCRYTRRGVFSGCQYFMYDLAVLLAYVRDRKTIYGA